MLLSDARVVPFPDRLADNLFTVRDKLDLHAASERLAAAGLRCCLGRDREGPCHDFLELKRMADGATAWTLVRAGCRVRAWRDTHGPDLGRFPGLGAALEAVLAAEAPPCRAPALPRPARAGH